MHPADRTHPVRAIITASENDGDQVVRMRYVLFYELAEGVVGERRLREWDEILAP